MSIDRLIEDLRAGLEGVTEGPWTLGTGSKGELCLVRQYSAYDYERISGEFAKDEDAEFLANCEPNNIRTLLDALAASQEENRRFREIIRLCDRQILALYNSISPHAEYVTSDGKSGNRFADQDAAVIAARSLSQDAFAPPISPRRAE